MTYLNKPRAVFITMSLFNGYIVYDERFHKCIYYDKYSNTQYKMRYVIDMYFLKLA